MKSPSTWLDARLLRELLLTASFALLSGGPSASAAAIKPQPFFGDWEATQLLVPSGVSNAQRSMNADDANVIGNKYSFQRNSVTRILGSDECTLDTSLARHRFSVNALFAGSGLPRPQLVQRRFEQRAEHYALGALAREPITVYAYRCKDQDTRLNSMGNWFAVSKEAIIWPQAPDALVLLKRAPSKPTVAQVASCGHVTLAADRVICADRELWLMRTYTEAVRQCAISNAPPALANLGELLDSYVAKRNKCESDRECIVYTLQEHVGVLAQRVPSTADCLASVHK